MTPGKWVIMNFLTGKDEPAFVSFPGEPTQEWIDGWNAGMEGDEGNPFPPDCWQHREWLDGYEAAKLD